MDHKDGRDGGPEDVGTKKSGKKVLVKKRKKRLGIACDKNCPACRVPCDTPFIPSIRKPK